jgi:quinol monooxygenase YgiN
MKIIVGYFTTKPGQRDAYLAAAQNHLERSRLDPDCLYIELVPMPDHPDRILLAEAFPARKRTAATRTPTTCASCGPWARNCCRTSSLTM